MLLQVHDELLFEAPEPEAAALADLVTRHMQEAVTLSVPLVVEVGIGPDWLEAKHSRPGPGRAPSWRTAVEMGSPSSRF